jgi:hypothetical protein
MPYYLISTHGSNVIHRHSLEDAQAYAKEGIKSDSSVCSVSVKELDITKYFEKPCITYVRKNNGEVVEE